VPLSCIAAGIAFIVGVVARLRFVARLRDGVLGTFVVLLPIVLDGVLVVLVVVLDVGPLVMVRGLQLRHVDGYERDVREGCSRGGQVDHGFLVLAFVSGGSEPFLLQNCPCLFQRGKGCGLHRDIFEDEVRCIVLSEVDALDKFRLDGDSDHGVDKSYIAVWRRGSVSK
jgi:hypothetical protein